MFDPDITHKSGLAWDSRRGVGFYPVRMVGQYDRAYFDKYISYRDTEVGRKLTDRRIELVSKWAGDSYVVDIGIGAGQFVEVRRGTSGYDVNPHGIRWLLDRDLWHDPYQKDPENATFWDSLEHLERPEDLLKRIRSNAFVSIPIFEDMDHVLSSKHFRTDEHFWYFTRNGFVGFMGEQGFTLLEENNMETKLGRVDIGTFVFRRSL